MAKINQDRSFDERVKGGKYKNAKRRKKAFIIGFIVTVLLFIGFVATDTADPATAVLYAAILGVIVGGLVNTILKKINGFIGKF